MLQNWLGKFTENGFAIVPGFLNRGEVSALLGDFGELRSQFRPAGIGKFQQYQLSSEIRRDSILWFEEARLTPAQNLLWAKLQMLKEQINQLLFIGLWDLEGHYAHYPPGGFYQRHIDRFSSDDLRTVSVVLYLNNSWTPADGGELVLYTPGGQVERVEPRAGTLVCFLSETVEHEVLASSVDRRSFAGWFRKRRTQ